MKQKLSQNVTYWLGVVAIGLVVGLSLQFVRAWTEPAVAPPGGNVGAPVNTGDIGQWKLGNLALNTNGTYAIGLLVPNGNVGIGTTTPGIAKTYVLNNGSNPSVGLYIGNGTPFGQAKLELDGPQATHIWVAENKSRVFSVTAGGNVNASGDICTDQGGGKCLSAAGGGGLQYVGSCATSGYPCKCNAGETIMLMSGYVDINAHTFDEECRVNNQGTSNVTGGLYGDYKPGSGCTFACFK